MRKIYTLLLVLFFIGLNVVNAQTGPGGIGNADGSNGQPENILWLRADDLSLNDGTSVSAWPDSSGNGNDLRSSDNTDVGDPTFSTGEINSLPAVTFVNSAGSQGSALIVSPFNTFASSDITTIIVFHTEDASDGIVSYASSASDNDYLLYNSSNLTTYINTGNKSSSVDLRQTAYQVMVNKWKNSNGELHLFQGGVDKYNYIGLKTGVTITDGGCLAIGGEQDGIDYYGNSSQAFDGDIAEIIMFSSYINDAQRTIIENYLQFKYGITIATDVFSSGDATYGYNITGIGQETDGNQTESSSAGFYVEADAGTLDDGEYIMFAHNNSSNSKVTIDLPSGVEARWAKDWYVEKTGSQDPTLKFDMPEGISGGQYPQNIENYVLLYRSSTSGAYDTIKVSKNYGDADQVAFSVLDADLVNGYYTLGTKDQTNSPVEGAPSVTWYTLVSGDWDDWNTWTLDPSGALPNNPDSIYPQEVTEKVVIKDGKTVTMNLNSLHCSSLKVDGRLDLTTTTGHTFDNISGAGRILMAADNFPSYTDMSDFVDAGQDEGTAVYYGSSSYSLNTAYTFYNMEVNMDVGQTVTLLKDYTINGNLTVTQGAFQINDNSATTNLNLTVAGDVTVNVDGKIVTGSADARHQFNMYGDLTNSGVVKFTNRSAADYVNEATDGIVDANFLNDSEDQNILCDSTTNFYRIEIDKGTDATYILNIDASDATYFNLWGYASEGHPDVDQLTANNNSLGLIKGTVRLGSNINVPVLTRSSNYNISEAAKLWVDGGSVAVTGNAIVPYGELYVSDGTFDALVTHGIAIRSNGVIRVSGGTVNTNIIRTASGSAATNKGAYVQTGGEVNVKNQNNSTPDYYHFCLTYPEMTFTMTGGTLHVYDANGTATSEGGIFIACDAENINVTGGTVIAEITTTTNPFKITSTAPFYNLILRNTYDSTTDHVLSDATDVGTLDVDLAAQPLVVLNDFTIEDNCFFDHNGQNITVGGRFSIAENSQKQGTNNYGLLYNSSKPNTLTFNGSGSDTLYIGHDVNDGYEMYVWNLTVNKSNGGEVVLKGDTLKDPTITALTKEYYNRLLLTKGTIDVVNGTLNQGHQSIRNDGPVKISSVGVFGVYEKGTTPLSAYIMLKDGTVIDSEDGAELGNIKLNPGDAKTVTLSSNVHIKRIGYYNGMLNLQTYNAKVDYLHKKVTEDYVLDSFCATDKMIYSDANASDGGLSILIDSVATYMFPLGTIRGTDSVYTYVNVTVSNLNSGDEGYITIRPVDGELKTTNLSGDDLLSYYWRVGYEGFTTPPDVKYVFKYDDGDIETGDGDNEANYYPGKVLDGNGYVRSYEQQSNVVTGSNTIKFDDSGSGSFELENANYTAGATNRFTGTVDKYYTYYDKEGGTGNGWYKNWDSASTWDKTSVGSGTHEVPAEGSIVFIQDRARVWGNNVSNAPAEVIFEFNTAEYGDSINQETVPRLQFNTSGTFDIGKVSGVGMISLNNSANPTVNADWGEFAANASSFLMYWGADATHTDIIQPCPSLMMEGSTQKIDQDIIVGADLILTGGTNFTPLQNIHIKRNVYVGAWSDGHFHFPDTGSPVIITVDGDVDYTYIHTSGDRDVVVDNSGNSIEHKLIVKGDIIQGSDVDYTLDLFSAQGETNVILELQGESNNSYTNSSGNAADLYRVVLNKGSNQNNSFTFSNDFTLNGPTSGVDVDKALELQNGTLILDDANIDIDLTTGDDNFEIPSTAALEVKQGTVNASGGSGILLDGKLKVSGGTVDMSGGDNFIQYSASGSATIEVTGGTLTVGSQIRRSATSTEGVLIYTQTGGAVEIGGSTSGVDSRGIFEILNTGSSFTHSGGSFTIVDDNRSNPAIASLYFAPETATLSSGTTITFGNGTTTAGDFTLYAGETLQNITTNNSGTKLSLSVVPCTVNEELTIGVGTEFDANGLDLTLKGDFINSGTFTASENSTYFTPTASPQTITGVTTFYNVYKSGAGRTLVLASDVTVDNELHLTEGAFDDGGNNLFVKGDMYIDITTTSGVSNDGIVANGTGQQNLYGSPTLARFKTDNANGVFVPTGNTITITDELKMNQGIFDIGSNLLLLTKASKITAVSPFSETNMVQTNISFTDAGIKKYFPVISSATTFVYPMGSGGKYTPVTLDISNSDVDNTYVRVKAANEIHPTITTTNGDPDNVLKYYWILDSEGASGFTGTATMQGYSGDIQLTGSNSAADYITARLLNGGSGNWDKYLKTDFNEATTELSFTFSSTDDAGIDGDYTAGLTDAIPDQVALYTSVKDGVWTDKTVWDPESPAGGPRGARVLVKHVVTIPDNYIVSYATEIDNGGTLKVNDTFGHRLGNTSGTGTLYLERGDMPAGDYVDFLASTGGVIEYGGTSDYDILSSMPEVNSVTVSGSGERRLPNIDVQLLGDLTINGPDLINEQAVGLSIKKDLNFTSGTYTSKTTTDCTVSMNGTSLQNINGSGAFTGTNSFYNFEVNNVAGVTLNTDIEIAGKLKLTSGVINSTTSNTIKITNSAVVCVVGGSNSSYVAGPLYKNISSSGNFVFPVGDNDRMGKIEVTADGSSGDVWCAQYFNSDATDAGMDVTTKASNVSSVSAFEYWNVSTNDGTGSANLTMYWDAASGVTPDDGFRIVKWTDATSDEWQNVDVGTKTGTSAGGSADLNSVMSFNEFAGGNFITFGGGPVTDADWQGDVSGSETDWFTAGNWSTNAVPTSTKDITIKNGSSYYPTIGAGSEVSINELTLESGASLTIDPGARVVVNGDITDANAAAGITIKNTVDNPTSFIYKGTAAASAKVEWKYAEDQYWYIGHSVDGADNSDYDTPTGSSFKLYKYNGAWSDITSDGSYNFDTNPLEGYAFKNTSVSEVTVSHTGNIHNENYNTSINGWNLIANPYQAYIDVESSGFNTGNSSSTIWTTSHSAGTGEIFYATYNRSNDLGENEGRKYIAPGQAFWLRNYSASTFSITAETRTTAHDATYYNLKNANVESDVLRIVLDNEGDKDEVAFAFRYYGKSDKFTKYDSEKRFGKAINVPNFYATKTAKKIAIGTYSDVITEMDSIPMGYQFSQSKQIVLRATNIVNFTAVKNVYLLDRVTGEEIDLRETPEYTFTSVEGGEPDRFVIYFDTKANDSDEDYVFTDVGDVDSERIQIYGTGQKGIVKITEDILAEAQGKGIIKLYSAAGSKIMEINLTDVKTTIDLPVNYGVYIIEVSTNNRVVTGKITRMK